VAIIRAEIWLEQVQYRMPQQEVTGGSRGKNVERSPKVKKDLKRDLEVF